MFDAVIHELERDRIRHVRLLRDGAPLSIRETVELWGDDTEFVDQFAELLRQCSYPVYRWETPAVTTATLDREFEFVQLNSPDLQNREPDTRSFAARLSRCSQDRPVATFENLGGDAMMVVPAGLVGAETYTDLASFSRAAPLVQQRALWRAVAVAMQDRVSNKPVWLSTAGGGVAWLHVRLDSRPKYYAHAPYRTRPA